MRSPDQPQPQPTKYPKGYNDLSPEYKAMWDAIVLEHPWFNHSKEVKKA